MPRSTHPPRLDYSNYTWRRVQITKLLVMQFSPLSRHLIPLRSKFLLSTLFSNTLSLCSSLNIRYQVSHPYRTAWHVSNTLIQRDFHCPTIAEEIRRFSSHCGARLRTHPNHLAVNLLGEPVYRRLRRYLPNDPPDTFQCTLFNCNL
jgi:hypothetical protein